MDPSFNRDPEEAAAWNMESPILVDQQPLPGSALLTGALVRRKLTAQSRSNYGAS